jgi:hypothetical protein
MLLLDCTDEDAKDKVVNNRFEIMRVLLRAGASFTLMGPSSSCFGNYALSLMQIVGSKFREYPQRKLQWSLRLHHYVQKELLEK